MGGGKLTGKVAIVTGGTRGIGAAIVRRLAMDGAIVGFSYIASSGKADMLQKELDRLGCEVFGVQANSEQPDEIAEFVRTVQSKCGRLDILVNSAGLSLMGSIDDPLLDITQIDRLFGINVTAVTTAVRTAVPFLGKSGRIINIGTVFAERSPLPGWGDYSATKGALAAYTRAWARDLGPRGITVNIVQPGPIDTDQNRADSAHAPMLSGMTALGRYGQPEEVAAVVAFLASDDASYVTGVSLNVDGGMLA